MALNLFHQYTESRLQRVRLLREPGHNEQFSLQKKSTSDDINVKKSSYNEYHL